MKKYIKYLLILILIFGIIFKISTVNAAIDPNAKKGDLRCNLNLDKRKYTCIENKTPEGEVWSVELTAKSDDGKLAITKVVTKTTELGKYDIYFKVKGDVPQNTIKNANVVLILDTSTSITGSDGKSERFIKMKEAVINFSKKFSDNPELKGKYKLALVQFATVTKNNINFVKTEFKNDDFVGNDTLKAKSHIELALEKAKNLLCDERFANKCKLLDSNASNNIIIFGDGLYANKNVAVQNGIDEYIELLKNENIAIYGIQYGSNRGLSKVTLPCGETQGTCLYIYGTSKSNELNINWVTKHKFKNCVTMYNVAQERAFSEEYKKCRKEIMQYLSNKEVIEDKNNADNWKGIFEQIADEIIQKDKQEVISGTLTDIKGEAFDYADENDHSFTFEKISGEYTTEKFSIRINPESETGWYLTNNKFWFGDENNPLVGAGTDANPEVYWIQEKLEYPACSTDEIGNPQAVQSTRTIESHAASPELISSVPFYYTEECTETIKSGLKINNLESGTKKFNLNARLGFSTDVVLYSNVVCTYSSLIDKLEADIKAYQMRRATTTQAKEIASINKAIESLNNIKNNYNNRIATTKTKLTEYENRFKEQNATLVLNYFDSNKNIISKYNVEQRDAFINSSDISSSINCDANQCSATFEKTLVLKPKCLNMNSGVPEECGTNSNEIYGGNKYYILGDKQIKGAYVAVKVPNIGYDQGLSITMKDKDDPACTIYSFDEKPIIYRQIELSDPFIKNNNKRNIGQNWSNNRYDFTGVIDKKTWSNKFEYQYDISKTDINKIKQSTNGEVNSYLGTNCKFSNNKWICPFVRPTEGQNGVNSYFTKITLNLDKINK